VTDAPTAAVQPPADRGLESPGWEPETRVLPTRHRWPQLVFGICCMVAIANLQYGWTLFVGPIDQKFHWGRTAIQVAFFIFILFDTWLVPFEGYLVDRFGPRMVVLGGGVLVAIAWVTNSFASSLTVLYIGAGIGGAGAGAVYGTAVGNSLKWFTDRRGLAAGLTAAGYGAGTALTVPPIASMIASHGYQAAFLTFGIVQGLAVLVFGIALRAPKPGEVQPAQVIRKSQTSRDYRLTEAVRTPMFWTMYVMFVMVAAGGLISVAQIADIAADFKVANVPVTLVWLTMPALTFTLRINALMNGLTRPFFGWVSDHLGRENTMFVAFLLEGAGIFLLLRFATNPTMFVVLSGLVFFAWGEIYSLFPATCADIFGRKYCTTIYGLLYTAKGTAALMVPLSAYVSLRYGWSGVFSVAALLNFVAAALALLVLRPARVRALSQELIPDAMGITRI
jgi:MFS transporter, OFA family, oxalate/formate antiporter